MACPGRSGGHDARFSDIGGEASREHPLHAIAFSLGRGVMPPAYFSAVLTVV
jgi:hypothetical protein